MSLADYHFYTEILLVQIRFLCSKSIEISDAIFPDGCTNHNGTLTFFSHGTSSSVSCMLTVRHNAYSHNDAPYMSFPCISLSYIKDGHYVDEIKQKVNNRPKLMLIYEMFYFKKLLYVFMFTYDFLYYLCIDKGLRRTRHISHLKQ